MMNQFPPFEGVVLMKTPVHAVKNMDRILKMSATGMPAYLL